MVKIIGIVGSPRRGGNTELLVKEALDAAKDEGAETELILRVKRSNHAMVAVLVGKLGGAAYRMMTFRRSSRRYSRLMASFWRHPSTLDPLRLRSKR